MPIKRWRVDPPQRELAAYLAEECDIDPFLALIAAGRGYTDPALLEEYLSPEVILSDPYELRDMEKAVEVIWDAVYAEELIAVYGDYDVDGVAATALLFDYLRSKGARVVYTIPDREKDGYGMNLISIDKLHAMGVTLIITVDNGIASEREVEYAASLGIKVVVTDHHLPPEQLPAAAAVIDPHRADDMSEFKEICGVFVAYKLLCALEGKSPEELLYDWGDLVALGTVADVMPLTYENRCIVREGLQVIAQGNRRGLTALMKEAAIDPYTVSASRLAFGIAPRINAAGRMGDAARAVELLLTDDDETAAGLASALNSENIRRQSIEKQILTEAVNTVEKKGYKHHRVIVVAGENWHHGVIGIVAARLCEKYGKPAVVLSCDGEAAHGSARSVSGFSIYEAIASCSYLLTRYGGHEMAAGISLYAGQVDDFRRAINEYAAKRPRPIPELRLDCKLNPAALSVDLAEELKQLEPFGTGNPAPVFGIFDLLLEGITPVGGGKHLKLTFSKGELRFQAMLFSTIRAAFPYETGEQLDIAVTLDVNLYGGEQNLTVNIRDLRKSVMDEEALFADIDLYESFKSGIYKEYSDITPTREEIAAVYKTVLKRPVSLKRLTVTEPNYAKALIAAEALCELGVLRLVDLDGIPTLKLADNATKVDLSDSQILRRLNGE